MTRLIWLPICLTAAVALSGSVTSAHQYGNQNKNDQNSNQNRNQQSRGDQNRQDHTKFDDHDQQVTRDWYKQHHDNAPVGLRDRDRLSSDEESRLRPGSTLDSHLRSKAHPIPPDLSRELPPPPRDSHYVALGGHVAQVDKRNHVQDVIHLELNF
jgi:Ni/Co efflux regulator RcnB